MGEITVNQTTGSPAGPRVTTPTYPTDQRTTTPSVTTPPAAAANSSADTIVGVVVTLVLLFLVVLVLILCLLKRRVALKEGNMHQLQDMELIQSQAYAPTATNILVESYGITTPSVDPDHRSV